MYKFQKQPQATNYPSNSRTSSSNPKRSILYTIIFSFFLFSFSYVLVGVWRWGTTISNVLVTGTYWEITSNVDTIEMPKMPLESAVRGYPPCNVSLSEYTPCEDKERGKRFTRFQLIHRERHCPVGHEVLRCRVPAPEGYRRPFRWPKSRDAAWFSNVPHGRLAVKKAVQNWVKHEGEVLRFPGGGTMFPDGADAYIDGIGKLIDLHDGSIRTALDTGCGVASWGAYLLPRNILTMSIAPKDAHDAQVQFALERGVPAMIGLLGSMRLPYPSRAFDMAHCSRCLIKWTKFGGLYLTEIDRVLRPGGYWILSGPPINWKKKWKSWGRTVQDLVEEQTQIEEVAKSLCWSKLVEKDEISIWQKPYNHLACRDGNNKIGPRQPFCPETQDPDLAWYTKMEACLSNLPPVSGTQEVAGGQLENWPERLDAVPPRISEGTVQGATPESFRREKKVWTRRISYYKTVSNLQLGEAGRYRNVLDMNSYLGGFAASLVDQLPVWVMNVVPVQAEVNTLGVIYQRGLIGTYQDWCEAMSTYPRTYDLIHADSVFSLYRGRCEMEDILLEMDRVLRPEGSVIVRDDIDLLMKIKTIADRLEWGSQIVDHEGGPQHKQKLLIATKKYWTALNSSDQ